MTIEREPSAALPQGAPATTGPSVRRVRYTLRSLGLSWSGYPGALLHSGLGLALAQVAPQTFADLIGSSPGNEDAGPRPWWLLPPLDARMILAPGDDFSLDLFFANPRANWSEDCAAALSRLGALGLGKTRGHFVLRGYESLPWRADGDPAQPDTLTAMLQAARPAEATRHLAVQLLTPLRIKAGGDLLRSAPSAVLLLQRVLARAAMLAGVRVAALPLAETALAQAQQLRISEQDLHWDDLSRFSARQQAVMPLGGLTGWLRYTAPPQQDLAAAYAWLAVGEWLHAGTKTTFGLGAYRLLPSRSPSPA